MKTITLHFTKKQITGYVYMVQQIERASKNCAPDTHLLHLTNLVPTPKTQEGN